MVCDPDGRCDDATVTVTVDPVDDAPIANDDAIEVADGKPVIIPVVDNDDEVDGEPVTVAVVDQPAHGTVTVEPMARRLHAGRGLRRLGRVHLRALRPRRRLLGGDGDRRGERVTAPPAEPREPEPDPEPQPGCCRTPVATSPDSRSGG